MASYSSQGQPDSSMNCYACGQRVSPETSFSDIFTHDEVYSILKTAQHVDDLISSLNATRSQLLQRLNKLRASTRLLPPEILSMIFCHAYPPPDFTAFDFVKPNKSGHTVESHGQMTLSTVSLHWRRVIFATPQLWTSAIINVSPANAERKAQLIQLYLTNVGNMNLSLHISPGSPSLQARSKFDPVFNSIWSGAHKIKLLSWSYFQEGWILSQEDRFTHLEDLRLEWASSRYTDTPDFQITSLPRLRHLYLYGTRPDVLSRPLRQSLTTIHFVAVHLHVCIKILLSCPNLVEYSCHGSKVDPRVAIPQLSEPMTFHHMKIFHAPLSTTTSFASILRHLNIPALETLGLELCPDTGGLEDLISFMIRLPATWRILQISGYESPETTVERIFQCVPPQVRSLHLPQIDCSSLGLVFTALHNFNDQHNPPMIGLQKICINSSDCCFTPMESQTNPPYTNQRMFLNMVSARKHCLRDGRFSLELGSEVGGYWEYYRERLEQMAVDGFKLNITIAGKTVYPPVG